MFLSTDCIYSILFTLLLLKTNFKLMNAFKCSRTPEGHGASQTPADGRFHIRIVENTNNYTPGKTYTIKIEGIDAGQRSMPPSKHKFSGFTLVVEKKTNDSGVLDQSIGTFSLVHSNPYSKIACPNMVTHTTTAAKSEIEVLWKAPQSGSGCVLFKATVIEHRDVWYMDDGPLTKEFCEKPRELDDEHRIPIVCCACTEAKYELTFEGLWSRNTHPKDFPSNPFITKFGDIIGASHTIDYRFWKRGQVATDGLMHVAEHGSTRELETELKSESGQIRTIIKAKGLAYPNITGRTFAVFRVDPIHSVISFVSMIDPSPDWFLGVAALDLCLEDCTWVESRTHELYPWDAGTDSGNNYTSPNQPTNPRDYIRYIKSDLPNDPESPFYPFSEMKPLARLHLSRQRLYEKNCPEGADDDSNAPSKTACRLGPWQEAPCDTECGHGNMLQQRQYINENLAQQAGCREQLTQRVPCVGRGPNCSDDPDEVEETTVPSCALSPWSAWSKCSTSSGCGNGSETRRRKYIRGHVKKYCEGGTNHPPLKQTRPCYISCSGEASNTPNGEEGDVEEEVENENEENEGNDDNEENEENEETEEECQMSDWSEWGPCSVPCGGGTMNRTRTTTAGKCEESELIEKETCNDQNCKVPKFCKESPVEGDCENKTNMWYYDWEFKRCAAFGWSCGTHGNKFSTFEDCRKTCSQRNTVLQFDDQPRRRKGNKGRNRNRNSASDGE
ncbi:Spondin-1 [Pseudolycoriella hygida]|uniref:Spondin-1 n=1 Tax=Pseudolycoriella hygida TaxID=35572 RepID=A0A9Q0S8S6_9DIPT|nr:Spondin-1 [Pseudolycoriella hygida]